VCRQTAINHNARSWPPATSDNVVTYLWVRVRLIGSYKPAFSRCRVQQRIVSYGNDYAECWGEVLGTQGAAHLRCRQEAEVSGGVSWLLRPCGWPVAVHTGPWSPAAMLCCSKCLCLCLSTSLPLHGSWDQTRLLHCRCIPMFVIPVFVTILSVPLVTVG
jgi:hypothetical protein